MSEEGTLIVSEEALKEAMGEEAKESRPTKLDEIDRLRLQNAFLRWHSLAVQRGNIKTQMEVLRRDAATADQEMEKAGAALQKERDRIRDKYDVDLRKMTVNEAGEFVPLPPGVQPPMPINGGKK